MTTASSNEFDLAWTDTSGGSASFDIERQTGTDSNWVSIASLPPGTQSYTDTAIISGQTYNYRLTAINSAGSSAPVNGDPTTPIAAPTDFTIHLIYSTLTGTDDGHDYLVQLDWVNRSPNAGCAVIQWNSPTSGWTYFGQSQGNGYKINGWDIPPVASGVYQFRIQSQLTNGSPPSQWVQQSVTVPNVPLRAADITFSMFGGENASCQVDVMAACQLLNLEAYEDAQFAVTVVGYPSHGTLNLLGYVYTPDSDFIGTDSFTYALTNGPIQSCAGDRHHSRSWSYPSTGRRGGRRFNAIQRFAKRFWR